MLRILPTIFATLKDGWKSHGNCMVGFFQPLLQPFTFQLEILPTIFPTILGTRIPTIFRNGWKNRPAEFAIVRFVGKTVGNMHINNYAHLACMFNNPNVVPVLYYHIINFFNLMQNKYSIIQVQMTYHKRGY